MIAIVKVEKKDVKELAALAKDIWFEYWNSILTLGQIYYMVNKFQSEIAINEQIEHENYSYYFIQENGVKIGYFGIEPQENCLFLSKLYISKDSRNKGYGHIAFEIIKKIALNNDLTKIQLTVNKQNMQTIHIYEKWGFKMLHPMVTNIGNGYQMDDYLMEYEIKEEN